MRIGVDFQAGVGGGWTGFGAYTVHLFQYLFEKDTGNQYRFYLPNDDNKPLKGVLDRLLWEQFRLPLRMLSDEPIDLFHSPCLGRPITVTSPVVATVHDLFPLTEPRRYSPLSRWYFTSYIPYLQGKATRIITDTDWMKGEIVSRLRFPDERVDVIPLFPSAEPYASKTGEVRQQRWESKQGRAEPTVTHSPLPSSNPYKERDSILFVGTLEARKGPQDAIAAYARLDREIRELYHLNIVGLPGDAFKHCKDLVDREGLTEFIEFLGYLPQERLAALYSRAALLVLPSRYEGFGLPPLEAAVFGTPSLLYSIPVLSEVYEGHSQFVEPGDISALSAKMKIILIDKEVWSSGSERVKGLLSKYSLEKTADLTIETYRRARSESY